MSNLSPGLRGPHDDPSERAVEPSGDAVHARAEGPTRASRETASATFATDARSVRYRLLLVEDEALIALELERRLARMGFDVVGVADNSQDAMTLFLDAEPDLVLMDICILGPVDGVETARAISRISDVPVVFLTAYADDETLRRTADVSPYGYVIKPFDERTLSATLTVALQRHAVDTQARLLGAAVESATIGISLVDVRGPTARVIFVNRAFVVMSGRTRDELVGMPPCLVGADSSGEIERRLLGAIVRRRHDDGVIRGRRPDGTRFWASVTVSPVPSRFGHVEHMLVFHKDITAQREAEAQLVDALRLETIGRMTAGIAHDFNNVLGAIVAFAEFACEGDPQSARADLEEILHAARRGAMFTRKLLDYSRSHDGASAGVADLAQVVAESQPMVSRIAGPRVRVDVQLEGDSPVVVGIDATSLEQVLMNLVSNARDALLNGGVVQVRVSRPTVPSGALEAGCYARLEVIDNGAGIDAQTRARVFEPLFTTKPRGRGTGLGLSTVRTLVERSGGSIALESEVGHGTTVTVDLPLTDGNVKESVLAAAVEEGNADGALCLLVEDDAALRRACARSLADAGFRVVDVATCEGACRELDARGGEVRLVVCDMVLEGETGLTVLERARAVAPNAGRLIVTGYFDDDLDARVAGDTILWKPFTMGTLATRALALLPEKPAE